MTEPICAGPCPEVSARDIPLPARIAWRGNIIKAILRWLDRGRQRRHMHRLSDHMLHDIGLSRADLEQDAATQFWHR